MMLNNQYNQPAANELEKNEDSITSEEKRSERFQSLAFEKNESIKRTNGSFDINSSSLKNLNNSCNRK